MHLLLRLIVSTIAVLVTDLILPGVEAQDLLSGLLVAVVLALLNTFLKPLLLLLTLPVTVLTLGLFILVINAVLVLLADHLITGFQVDGFWWALLFSIILSIVQGILQRFDPPRDERARDAQFHRLDR
ncbi:MAG: phage holin family protein [Bacteroidota bacterium]|nr:phage holin family protein [Bacteroidota bacterium]